MPRILHSARRSSCAVVLLITALHFASGLPLLAGPPLPLDGPLAPDKAPASFQLEPGLRLELVAAEPLVVSPVAVAFDERGRAYVVENRGYPTGPGPDQPPAGRIALLEDTDFDGRFDRRTEFADNLTFPNGLLPWDGGLIVTCAPDIYFLKDTDGDGKADERRTLLTGFATSGSTQLRVSHPTLGLDGWIYVTSGLTGGQVKNPHDPQQPTVETRRTDLRFRLNTRQENAVTAFEAADGGSQFGMTFDNGGQRFICYNRVQVQHVVTASRYWRRNPHLAFSETVQNCPVDLAPEPVRGHGQAARLYPISTNVTTADSHAGTFTAACAVTTWRGSQLPDAYAGGVLSCDPTGNLVHFDQLVARGATFDARRARDGSEFLASTDNWFRPVFLAHGPEGALYVCDMYRKTIEHPDYLPVEIRKHTDFESGKKMGRIWRVVREDASAEKLATLRQKPLRAEAVDELLAALGDSNGWRRETAFRLLLEQRALGARMGLLQLFASSDTPDATALAAFWLLHHLQALDDDLLARSLTHRAARVREAALTLVEPKLSKSPEWLDRVLPATNDADARVRFQAALTLGEVKDEKVLPALASLARRDGADRWLRAAVFSSIGGREKLFLTTLLSATEGEPGAPELYIELGRLVGAALPPVEAADAITRVLAAPERITFPLRAGLLSGLTDALRSRGIGRAEGSVWNVVLPPKETKFESTRTQLQQFVRQSLAVATRDDADVEQRRLALALLSNTDFASAGDALLPLVDPSQPPEVQAGATRALGLMHDERIAARLLDAQRFPAYTPRLREEVIAAMLSSPQHHPGLLTALEASVIPPGAIDSLRRKQLTENKDPALRDRANKIYQAAGGGDRAKVYDEYKSVVELPSNAANGQQVFKRVCAACHRLDREGTPVGPDLFGIRNQPKESILLHILIPEREITQGYAAYVVTTKDGRVLTGLLSAETPTSITLKQSLGKEDTILRSDIDELIASRLSLMPQELEKTVSRQEFADLLAYLKGEKR